MSWPLCRSRGVDERPFRLPRGRGATSRGRPGRGKGPSRRSRSLGGPSCTTRPLSITTMRSKLRRVESRWAMAITVRFCISRSSAWRIISSDSPSSDDVASSSSRIGVSFSSARAMAMRWRWPAESRVPRSPTTVEKPSGSASMKSRRVPLRRRGVPRHRWRPGVVEIEAAPRSASSSRRFVRSPSDSRNRNWLPTIKSEPGKIASTARC